MQNHLLKYKDWISESETPAEFKMSGEDIEYIQDNCKIAENLKKAELSAGFFQNVYSHKFSIDILAGSLKEYFDALEKAEIEFVPHYFETSKMRITFARDKKMDSGKYLLDILGSESSSHKSKFREFHIDWNADNKDQVVTIVNKAIEEVIGEIKKVRVMVQVGKKNLPDSLKPILKKKVLDNYKNVVDSFFYKQEIPEDSNTDLGSIIAEIYASDKTILNTISDIENDEMLDSIVKALEKMDETEAIKVIKAYLRSTKILKFA
jgi:hypothetical protein